MWCIFQFWNMWVIDPGHRAGSQIRVIALSCIQFILKRVLRNITYTELYGLICEAIKISFCFLNWKYVYKQRTSFSSFKVLMSFDICWTFLSSFVRRTSKPCIRVFPMAQVAHDVEFRFTAVIMLRGPGRIASRCSNVSWRVGFQKMDET